MQLLVDTDSKILTIIICTYDRNNIIDHCLESITNQSADINLFDVLIVNNCNRFEVQGELEEMIKKYDNVSLIKEQATGLSKARNSGANAARTEWIGYIDDDCKPPRDFITKALQIIRNHHFGCFGGHIESWWLYDRPRWLDEEYGSKPKLIVDILTIEENYLWGGNIFFKKAILHEVGGFDENAGMKANKIGYSAENKVQMRLREKGHKIGYDSNLIVGHLVAPHKLKLFWHLKAAYAEGRDGRAIFEDQYSTKALFKDLLRIPKSFLEASYALFQNSLPVPINSG